ncbi:reverse transcriptase domain-containing protein, partial [Enterocloster bolteae]
MHSLLLCIGRKSFPLLANIYLNEFDQEYHKRGVVFVRYADDIVLLAK